MAILSVVRRSSVGRDGDAFDGGASAVNMVLDERWRRCAVARVRRVASLRTRPVRLRCSVGPALFGAVALEARRV